MQFTDQAMVLSRIAQAHSGDNGFSVPQLEEIFFANALPRPKNLHDVVAKLRKGGFLTTTKTGKSTITPLGRFRSVELFSEMDLATFAAESATPKSILAHVIHTVVPP